MAGAEDQITDDLARDLGGAWRHGAVWLAVGLAVLHLAAALVPFLSEIQRNTIHFAGFTVLCALWFPMARGMRQGLGQWLDLALGLAVAAAAL